MRQQCTFGLESVGEGEGAKTHFRTRAGSGLYCPGGGFGVATFSSGRVTKGIILTVLDIRHNASYFLSVYQNFKVAWIAYLWNNINLQPIFGYY
jgi:hypothetical protein